MLMRKLLPRLFPIAMYADPLVRRRAMSVYAIAGLLIGGAGIGALGLLLVALSGSTLPTELGLVALFGAAMAAASFVGLYLTRRGQQTPGALVIVGVWFGLIALLMLTGQVALQVSFGALLVGISLGALLVGHWLVPYVAAFSALFVFLAVWFSPGLPAAEGRSVLLLNVPILIVHSVVSYALAQSLRLVARRIAADTEERSMRLAGASRALAERLLIARLDLPALLAETVTLVRETFPGVDEAQVFLVDKDRRNATLVASTSATGQANQGQQIGVGSLNVIGRATISGRLVLVRDTPDEQAFRRAAFLENTRAELVIPLRIGGETIGALDMHSHDVNAFSPEEIQTFETLTNQIAVAIDNARMYADTQAQLAESQRLYEQASQSLHEFERLNQQLTGGAWAEYLRGMRTVPAYTIDPVTGRVEDAAERTQTMSEVIRRNQAVVRGSAQSKIVALPISVRGQVIGAMEFDLPPDQHVGPDQMVILQQVVERLGLAIENIRLLDEAQRIAQREAMVNEITARIQTATNVESVIAAATQSLADAFEAPRVAIRLGLPRSNDGGNPDTGARSNGA